MSSSAGPSSPVRMQQRGAIACLNCRRSKIKCSGEQPCSNCSRKQIPDDCRIIVRDRNISVPRSRIRQLEQELHRLRQRVASLNVREDNTSSDPVDDEDTPIDDDVDNPLLGNQDGLFAGQRSSEPVFVGEGACTAFGDRLLQCVDQTYSFLSANTIVNHVKDPILNRVMWTTPPLPEYSEAKLLIQRAVTFIGVDYNLLLRKSFFRQLEQTYIAHQLPSLQWGCQLFALLAIGQMYSHIDHTPEGRVPGSAYFVYAVGLLQDAYEEPSVQQVQSLTLLSFYSNVLGRVKSAHVYAGIATRIAISLGLHRSQLGSSHMDPVQRENRRRVWWTLYLFDRLTSSKLGYPLAIQDDDIDVEMPSMEGLSDMEREEFAEPEHLCANVKLAKITGSILNDIHGLPRPTTPPFINRVQRVLKLLHAWNEALPPHLNIKQPSPSRGVYSLHMLYNLCIIQTTRPILLYIFKSRMDSPHQPHPPSPPSCAPSASSSSSSSSSSVPLEQPAPPAFSPTAHLLAESCITAARALNQHLAKLYADGNLAVYGYFDTHYLFSSTIILIIAHALENPAGGLGEGVQTALVLLRKMRNCGNVVAGDYLGRLEKMLEVVRRRVQRDRKEVEVFDGEEEWRGGWGQNGPGGNGVIMEEMGGLGGGGNALDNPEMDIFLADEEFGNAVMREAALMAGQQELFEGLAIPGELGVYALE